ncbi:hypothetical protein Btru_065468 [Bulinus truncatus]|nr:hypothetical protein Btru_065468 [Bulinus truncatus]
MFLKHTNKINTYGLNYKRPYWSNVANGYGGHIRLEEWMLFCHHLATQLLIVGAEASDFKTSYGATCVDQCQTVQYMINTISNQSVELKYFVSKFPYQSATNAESYCAALGGYLAEIDDQPEYKALQNLVLGLPVDLVLIGGSDSAVEGTWIFPRTGKSVPILDWIPGQPDNLGNEDCLNLWKTNGGKMNDLPCGFRSSEDRFMCETPVLDSP